MKQIQYLKNYLILFLILSCSACKKNTWCGECFERSGKVVTEKRTVTAFNQIIVNHDLNVSITQDSIFELKIEAGKKHDGFYNNQCN